MQVKLAKKNDGQRLALLDMAILEKAKKNMSSAMRIAVEERVCRRKKLD
jgi:hypothetical protein